MRLEPPPGVTSVTIVIPASMATKPSNRIIWQGEGGHKGGAS